MVKGFACGVFDLFHIGHVLMLQECKENCEHLTVAINKAENIDEQINPGKQQPIFTWEQRKIIMESCKYVDEVLMYNSEDELLHILKKGSYNIRFLGEDYKGKPITGAEYSKNLYYTNRAHGFSTSKFKEMIVEKCKSK